MFENDEITQDDRVNPEIVQIEMGDERSPIKTKSERSYRDAHCVLELISAKFHCVFVAQKGTFKIKTKYGELSGDLKKSMNIVHEYGHVGFHLRYTPIPRIGYTPLMKAYIYVRDNLKNTIMSFQLTNVMVHFDENSTVKSVLNHRSSCSFTYRNPESNVAVSLSCVRFPTKSQGFSLTKYFGIGQRVKGKSLNKHGVRKSDIKFSEPIMKMYSAIKKRSSSEEEKYNLVIEKHPVENTPKISRLIVRSRRQFPFKTFELKTHKVTKSKNITTRFLFTTGNPDKGSFRAFVSPVSGHKSFTLRIGNSLRTFSSFSKFVRTLAKWNQPCHDTAKFRMFNHSKSPKISLWFNYNPKIPGNGEIKLQYWDMYGTLMNTYACSIEHLCGVFSKKALMSSDSNIHNQRDWAEREHCPHEDGCPRNCAHFIPSLVEMKNKTRIPIPKAIPCACVGDGGGYIPIVSYYHYQIELCNPVSIRMGGFFKEMLHDHRNNPEMYKNSSIVVLLNSHHDLLYHIETFLYGFKRSI